MVALRLTVAGCIAGPRPCPAACRHRIPRSQGCALDVASRGPLEIGEIAELLGTSEGAIRWTVCIALKKLRGAYERAAQEEE